MDGLNFSAIMQAVSTVVIGVIGFFIKRELKRLDDVDRENKHEIEKIKVESNKNNGDIAKSINDVTKNLNEFKDSVNKDFLRKIEHYQAIGEISKKLDKIFDILFEMKGRAR